ncbi:MAG: hypothetical protein U0798_01180 [Gemmataceae bacterium]
MKRIAWMPVLCSLISMGLFTATGCGSKADQANDVAENVRRIQQAEEKLLKGIADNAELSDADAIKKYLDSTPTVPKNLAADVAPGWAANQIKNQWHLIIHAMHQSQDEDSTPDERMKKERNTIRWHMASCKRMLEHLKGRKVESVTISLYTKVNGQDKHTELFRAVLTQADLSKFDKFPDGVEYTTSNNLQTANEGTVYDPRGSKIGTCWTVELNRYPDLSYKKKGS